MTSFPDILFSFARFGREQSLSLKDPKAREAFLADVTKTLDRALDDGILLHGHRTQNMFEGLLVALGQFALLKLEDVGRVHPAERWKVPDFRVVLQDGRTWLIEVKNVFAAEPFEQQFSMTLDYLGALEDYAKLMQAELKVAVYWARWRIWTLFDPKVLQPQGGKLTISMGDAVRCSELAALGDYMLGTKPPLVMRFVTDTAQPRTVEESGDVKFTIGAVQFYAGGVEITDPVEQKIAFLLMEYGEWDIAGPHAVTAGGQLDAIEFTWEPCERSNEGFEIIGTLSRFFARIYASQTTDEKGITQLEAKLVPGLFLPLIQCDPKTMTLPLWKFFLQPQTLRKARAL